MPKGIYNRKPEILEKLKDNFGKEAGFSYWKGKHRSEDTKKKLRQYRTGKKHSAETIEKMKLSRSKRVSSEMKGDDELLASLCKDHKGYKRFSTTEGIIKASTPPSDTH